MKKYVLLLAMAAVVAGLTTACTGEDSALDTPLVPEQQVEPTEPQKIHVTVGAGIGDDDAQTRSQVETSTDSETGKTTRTLKFTTGDQLYIVGDIDDTHRMGGYLDLTSGDGTTSATFSGDLTVWVTSDGSFYTEDNSYTLQHANPMDEYGSNEVTATLIHKNAITGSITIDSNTKLCSFNYSKCLVKSYADNASGLMKTGIHVRGTYDATTESFPLACGDPIFNCNFTIDGLEDTGRYYVRIVKDEASTTYNDISVSPDLSDKAFHFAITTDLSGSGDWKIQIIGSSFGLSSSTDIYERPIGNKTLGAKVYNVGNYTGTDPGTDPGTTLNPATDVVSLSQVTSAFVGNIVGSDGNVYPHDATMPEGVSKAAMLCYVSSTGHGLAIELNSSPSESFFASYTYPAGITGGSWRTPSREDWQNMVKGCGHADYFISNYNATGVAFNAIYYSALYVNGIACRYCTSESVYYEDPVHPDESGVYAYYIEFSYPLAQLSIHSVRKWIYQAGFFHLACFEF